LAYCQRGDSKLDPKGKDSLCDMMFNKIILLLVLLIPSLCFGRTARSIKFLIVTDLEKQTQSVIITDSALTNRQVVELKMHNETIFFEDNKKALVELLTYINVVIGENEIGGRSFNYMKIRSEVIESAVRNHFQITFLDKEIVGKTILHNIFLYKPEKK
jgi:hypothetical protein